MMRFLSARSVFNIILLSQSFLSLLLAVANYKFGVHYRISAPSTLGGFIASITLSPYALQCQRSADYLGVAH